MSWLPYGGCVVWMAVTGDFTLHPVVATLPAVIAKCSTVWNPIIFIASDRRLRGVTKALILCRFTVHVHRESSDDRPRVTPGSSPTVDRPRVPVNNKANGRVTGPGAGMM